MKRSIGFRAVIAFLAATAGLSEAQNPAGPGTGINATFARLFGAHTAFTAHANVLVAGKQKTTMPMEVSLSGSRMRMEVDIMSMRVGGQPQQGAEMFKNIGLDRIITVSRFSEKSSLIIVPGLQATVETPMPEEEADSLSSEAKVEFTEPEKETIAGHPCVRNRFVITDAKGRKREGAVWKATDLKDFPIQIRMLERDTQMILRFSDIKFESPDARLFVAPSGYKSYREMSDLLEVALARTRSASQK